MSDLTIDPLVAKYGLSRDGHSIFAPSSAAGWLYCSGFLLANAGAGDTAGIDAAYGTVAHAVAEEWNKTGKKPVKLLGTKQQVGPFEIEIDADMMMHVERYVDWCAELPGDHYFEQRVDLTPIMPIPGQGGTADHFACEPGKLTITDLKMGSGVRVYADENPQAMLYALGVFFEWDWIYHFDRIIIRICQPRLGVFEVWETDRKSLLEFADFAQVRARLAWQEKAPRTPSAKSCKWCRVANTCPARLKHVDDTLDDIFGTDDDDESLLGRSDGKQYEASEVVNDDLMLLPGMTAAVANRHKFKRLSTNALSYVLTFRPHIERMFADIAEEALERAERGEKLPFQKLTDGRQQRVWGDKAKAAEVLVANYGIPEDEVAPPRLVSPAQAEKLLRKHHKAMTVAEAKMALEDKAGAKFRAAKRTLAPLRDDRPDTFDATADIFDTDEEDEL